MRIRMIALAALLLSLAVQAQDYQGLINQQLNQMNQDAVRAQQMVNGMVQQRMKDPQVQAAYREHVAQAQRGGRPAMDYPTFTYNYIYTNGFSAAGVAHARNNEAGMQARERAAVQGLRDAQANRGAAMQAQRDGHFANQQEAGRQLMGNSTYTAPNGATVVLPHTWQRNTTHRHQGQTYRVDESGQYHVLGSDGWWYRLNR